LISCGFALGEEIGFRGYLLPRLMPLGTTRALLLSGFLHGIWHFPLILIAGALPIAGSWLIAGPIFLAVMTAAGVIYGYFFLTSGSVYPPTLAHGTINSSLNLFKGMTVTATPVALTYAAGETGLVLLAVTTLAAAWCLYRLRQPSAKLALGGASA
jgi:membrane protease YdiL (CAAX protease family)